MRGNSGNSKSFSRAPYCMSPHRPHQPFPSPLFCDAPSLSHHALGHVFSLVPLLDVPPSLPKAWEVLFWFIFFLSLSSFPAYPFSFLSRCLGPPLAGKCKSGVSTIFHACLLHPSSAHECEVHASLFFTSFSFSFS